jgi:hypothetical protein
MSTVGTLSLYGGVNRVKYGATTYIRGEYLEYIFPEYVTIGSYILDFLFDSQPAVWYILAKNQGGQWVIVDSQDKRNATQADVTPEFHLANTFSNTLTTPVFTNSVRIQVAESTAPSVKLRNFRVYDIAGMHVPFLIPFCQKTNSSTHTGSLNFSCIDRFSIESPKLDTTYFAVKHNVLEIGNGMAKLKWN